MHRVGSKHFMKTCLAAASSKIAGSFTVRFRSVISVSDTRAGKADLCQDYTTAWPKSRSGIILEEG